MANIVLAPLRLYTLVRRQIWTWRYDHGPPMEPKTRPLKSRYKQDWASHDVHDQQCALLDRLPQEIRLIIWTFVLGAENAEDVIHWDVGHGNIRSRRCLREGQLDELGFKHVCWELVWSKEDCKPQYGLIYMPEARNMLSLLRTCKLIYGESVQVLYSMNVFNIRRAECLIRLPKVIASQHLKSIASIQFSTAFYYPVDTSDRRRSPEPTTRAWIPPDDAAKWPDACSILASMKLVHLNITIALWVREPRLAGVEDDVEGSHYNVLLPLMPVRATEYRVFLTAPVSQDVVSRLGTMPFTLGRDVTPDAGYDWRIHLAD